MAAQSESSNNLQINWLKSELFEEILKNKIGQFKKIKDFKAHPALSAGENYVSNILRIELEVELEDAASKKFSFILKLPQENQTFEDLLATRKHNSFIVEIGMYRDILPVFESLYSEAGVEVKFCTSAYKLNTNFVHILFDDLRPYGFKTADRLNGLDMNHLRMVLRKLAQFHAVSAKYVERKGEYHPMYKYGYFTEEGKPLIAGIKGAMGRSFLKYAKNFIHNDDLIESIQNLQDRFINEFYRTIEIDPEEFNVLNHGDCWTNNIMFQYEELNRITETYFIDFQIPKYGSPAQDLLYFLMSSPKLEFKIKKFDFLISCYHEQLEESLKLLKYSGRIPTPRDIHCMLFKHGFWGYEAATGALAAVLVEPTSNATFKNFYEESTEGEEFRRDLYTNKNYIKHLDQILPWLYNRGALDCTNI